MKKILLIEDNTEISENTAEILELAGYEVITAENGRVGVENAHAEKHSIDYLRDHYSHNGRFKCMSVVIQNNLNHQHTILNFNY